MIVIHGTIVEPVDDRFPAASRTEYEYERIPARPWPDTATIAATAYSCERSPVDLILGHGDPNRVADHQR